MHIGWLDTCIRVARVTASRTFYEALGFHRTEGNDNDGWAVMVNGDARIGLFEHRYMETSHSLNFRGANLTVVAAHLQEKGITPQTDPLVRPDGSGSITLRDPDGHMIFLDSAPGETKKT